MKTIEIFGDDRENTYTKKVEGCRGIIIRGGQILLSFYKNQNRYLIPGGGIEGKESLTECCCRELAEEVGLIVDAHTHYLTLEEYYHEFYFKSHYFLCGYVSECERKLTENEKATGLEPRWLDFNEALKIFGEYEKYINTDEVTYGAYYREYVALSEFKNMYVDKDN